MIQLTKEFSKVIPGFRLSYISCIVENQTYSSELWREIDAAAALIKTTHNFESIRQQLQISATRLAYKKLGKDPNRYRPSAEALLRRLVKGGELYQINTMVDLINLISLHSGYSIGGFDSSKIEGTVSLGVGKPGEPYEAIGRGQLNVENLPIYRDDKGGIGTPTSDHERTSISTATDRVLLVINDFSGAEAELHNIIHFTLEQLRKYVQAKDIDTGIIGV